MTAGHAAAVGGAQKCGHGHVHSWTSWRQSVKDTGQMTPRMAGRRFEAGSDWLTPYFSALYFAFGCLIGSNCWQIGPGPRACCDCGGADVVKPAPYILDLAWKFGKALSSIVQYNLRKQVSVISSWRLDLFVL